MTYSPKLATFLHDTLYKNVKNEPAKMNSQAGTVFTKSSDDQLIFNMADCQVARCM